MMTISETTHPLLLSSGLRIRVRRAPLSEVGRFAPLTSLAARQPQDAAGQATAFAQIAQICAPYVDGADAAALCDAFTSHPRDMPVVVGRILDQHARPLRGKPRR